MGQKIKLISLLILVASLTTMGLISNPVYAPSHIDGGTVPAPQNPPIAPVPSDRLDPFLGDWKCYNVTPINVETNAPNLNVDLLDQFKDTQYDLDKLIKICTTTFKEGNADPFWPESPFPFHVLEATQLSSEDQHYVVYNLCSDFSDAEQPFECLDPELINFPVTITDQFGPTSHDELHDPVELWVPAEKDHNGNFQKLHDVHYLCYDIEPQQNALGQPLVLTLFDQFFPGGTEVTIDLADKLCNPVEKNDQFGGGNIPPIEHLKCYDITDPANIAEQPAIKDQFIPGGRTLQMIDEEEFCSAADKAPFSAIGGTLIPIDSVSLAIALVGANTIWILPLVAFGAAAGLIAFKRSKKNKNSEI